MLREHQFIKDVKEFLNELPVLKLSSQMQAKKMVLIARAEDILDSASEISSSTFSNGDDAQKEPNEYEIVLNETQFESSEYEVPKCEDFKIPPPSCSLPPSSYFNVLGKATKVGRLECLKWFWRHQIVIAVVYERALYLFPKRAKSEEKPKKILNLEYSVAKFSENRGKLHFTIDSTVVKNSSYEFKASTEEECINWIEKLNSSAMGLKNLAHDDYGYEDLPHAINNHPELCGRKTWKKDLVQSRKLRGSNLSDRCNRCSDRFDAFPRKTSGSSSDVSQSYCEVESHSMLTRQRTRQRNIDIQADPIKYMVLEI